MTLAASGYISLADNASARIYPDNRVVNVELGYASNATITFPSTDTRNLTGVGSGRIILPDDFWGKTDTFTFYVPAGANVNFRTAAINAGWDQAKYLIGILQYGNVITSSSTGSPGLTISGSYPKGVKFINQSTIYGAGGGGGNGSDGSSNGTNGSGGGTALYVSSACTVDNSLGELRGGGGGGGGGGGYYDSKYGPQAAGGGGGGGGGYDAGSGGTGGGLGAANGTAGTNGGGGGAGGTGTTSSYSGGNGGAQGSSGSAGSSVGNRSAGSGGAAGSSTQGSASYITWVGAGYGTRIGPVN